MGDGPFRPLQIGNKSPILLTFLWANYMRALEKNK